MSRLDDIRARLEAATPGPWKVAQGASGCNWIDGGGYDEVLSPDTAECMAYCYGGSSQINLSDNDADLIAHAPDDLAYLLAKVERLTGQLADQADIEREAFGRGVAWADALDDAADRLERRGQATKGDA